MKIWSFKSLILLVGLGFFITSCTDDGTGGTTPTVKGPAVTLEAGSGVITADATVNINEEFTVIVKGSKSDFDMATLTIEEASVKIALDRLNGVAANPVALIGTDRTSFTRTIKVKAHSTIGDKTYSFVVADANGNKSTKSIKITTKGTPPSITLTPAGADNVTVGPNSTFSNAIKVTKGTSKLKTIEVLRNDVLATDKENLYLGDQLTVPFASNPLPLPAANVDGFDGKILIRTPTAAGIYKYTIIFTDEAGLKATQIINVTVGTLVETIEGVLLNQAGMAGTGALDLDTGMGAGTGSTVINTEIRDMGINLGNPAATNWKQLIAGINGSEVKYIKKGLNGVPETFSFANIATKEDITALFDKGTAFTKLDGTIKVSDVVAKDDVFIVKNGAKYYVLLTKAIKVTVAAGDNLDSYTFDIKK